MKAFAILVFASLWMIHVRVSNADYRYRRMPPQPPRIPPVPAYLKKWHNAHMRQSMGGRPRPIPVHLGVQQQQQQQLQQLQQQQQFKKPVGPPIPKRSVMNVRPKLVTPAPMQNWNSNQAYVRQPPPPPPPPQEKPFLSSPKVQVSEYEYHIQTNQIPNHSNLIKQIDEKGPIHTIPAPNLSLADKPAHLEIQAPKQQTIVEIQKSHQYQVTEVPEIIKNNYKQSYPIQTQPQEAPQLQLQTEAVLTPNDQLSQVSQQDLYKFFQNYQQPLIESYNIPALQQPQLQEHVMQQQAYQTLISQQPVFQAEPTFLSQFQQTVQQKDIKPEFHTFNYEEPTQKSASSQVSAEYSVQPENYFDHQTNTDANNNVEPEINYFQNFNYPGITEDADPGNFYSSLPNKQTADALASLQEAGKRKINAHEEVEGREGNNNSMTIYVPDDSEENEKNEEQGNQSRKENGGNNSDGANYEYDDSYSQEDDVNGEISEAQVDSFGSRIKPKKY